MQVCKLALAQSARGSTAAECRGTGDLWVRVKVGGGSTVAGFYETSHGVLQCAGSSLHVVPAHLRLCRPPLEAFMPLSMSYIALDGIADPCRKKKTPRTGPATEPGGIGTGLGSVTFWKARVWTAFKGRRSALFRRVPDAVSGHRHRMIHPVKTK